MCPGITSVGASWQEAVVRVSELQGLLRMSIQNHCCASPDTVSPDSVSPTWVLPRQEFSFNRAKKGQGAGN